MPDREPLPDHLSRDLALLATQRTTELITRTADTFGMSDQTLAIAAESAIYSGMISLIYAAAVGTGCICSRAVITTVMERYLASADKYDREILAKLNGANQ
jgi:hypothetical protein